MAQQLTPEQLEIYKALQAAKLVPQEPAAPPPDLAQPYNEQAGKYRTEADTLEKQAATPYPQPQSLKERVVAGIQSGMQDFGRWSVPGGSQGQEALKQKQFSDENAGRISRAKELRNQAQQQQEYGGTVAQRGIQNSQAQAGHELDVKRETRLQNTADQPNFSIGTPGQQVVKTAASGQEPSFTTVPGEKPKPTQTGIVAEYEYAKTNGYKGSFTDYQNEDANRKNPPPNQYMQPAQSYGGLPPDARARVDAVANKVASGEYTPANGLSALGGVRGGLGGALTEALTDRRILPTAVRTANTDIERAKNLLVPVKQLIADIDRTPDITQKIQKSAQLEQYIQAIGTQFARARGERGVVTDKDVDRVLGLIPGWKSANFAPGYAQQNIALVEEAFNRDQESLFGNYFTQFNNDGKPTQPPTQQPQTGQPAIRRYNPKTGKIE